MFFNFNGCHELRVLMILPLVIYPTHDPDSDGLIIFFFFLSLLLMSWLLKLSGVFEFLMRYCWRPRINPFLNNETKGLHSFIYREFFFFFFSFNAYLVFLIKSFYTIILRKYFFTLHLILITTRYIAKTIMEKCLSIIINFFLFNFIKFFFLIMSLFVTTTTRLIIYFNA